MIGIVFVRTVIDDPSRIAYAEICNGETATAIVVLRRAVAWWAATASPSSEYCPTAAALDSPRSVRQHEGRETHDELAWFLEHA